MPNKHNADRRHRIPRRTLKVTNWREYEAGPRRRGGLTLEVDDAASAGWSAPPRTPPGGQARYSDLAIETALMVGLVVHQPRRRTEGLLRALLELLGLEVPVPDPTTMSRRSGTMTPVWRESLPDGPVHLVIASTGLKGYGAGAWQADKQGARGPRTWHQLSLAIDAASDTIVAAVLTPNEAGDASQVGPLLAQTTGPIAPVIADGAYDGEPVCQASAERDANAAVLIPPRATAVPSPATDTDPSRRDRHIRRIAAKGRLGWQRETS